MTRVLRVPRETVRLEDHLAEHEPWYRSRGEAQIGRMLERYGIPFTYEQPLHLHNGTAWRQYLPDFSLPTDRTVPRYPLILEYLGMPDRADYMDRWKQKLEVYRMNQVPLKVIRPDDLSGPGWPGKLARAIQTAHAAAYNRDMTMRSPPFATYHRTHARRYACAGQPLYRSH